MPFLIARNQWGAEDPRAIHPLKLPVSALIYGHTLTDNCKGMKECKQIVLDIQARNMLKYSLADIRFNFLVDVDGNVYVGRGWRVIPNVPKRLRSFTYHCLYIGLIGTFTCQWVDMALNMISRVQWGARMPKSRNQLDLPAIYVFFCYTWSKPCSGLDDCREKVRDLQDRNMDKYKLTDIRYSFLLDEEANVYICRGWKTTPSLPEKYRKCTGRSIFFGYIGFFADKTPNERMVMAGRKMVEYGVKKQFIAKKHLQFNM